MKPSIVYNCHVTCCDWSQQVTWYRQRGTVLRSIIGRVRGIRPVTDRDAAWLCKHANCACAGGRHMEASRKGNAFLRMPFGHRPGVKWL
ncbi:unnamed protein product, partial [Staurois parvus]